MFPFMFIVLCVTTVSTAALTDLWVSSIDQVSKVVLTISMATMVVLIMRVYLPGEAEAAGESPKLADGGSTPSSPAK